MTLIEFRILGRKELENVAANEFMLCCNMKGEKKNVSVVSGFLS